MIILLGFATVVSTLLGGLFALRFKDKLHLILGFSAGAVIGVAFFDLLPEAIELGSENYSVSVITSIVAAGFIFFMMLDRFIRPHPDEECLHEQNRGRLSAGSIAIHSFLDGAAIGLAFKVSSAVGLVVAVAVLAHNFFDGINTVNLIFKNSGNSKQAKRWLLLDALAPAVGVVSTMFFSVPQSALGIILAVFCGFFLHMGASDLLPESFHRHPTKWTTFATILGVLTLYFAIQFSKTF